MPDTLRERLQAVRAGCEKLARHEVAPMIFLNDPYTPLISELAAIVEELLDREPVDRIGPEPAPLFVPTPITLTPEEQQSLQDIFSECPGPSADVSG